MNELFLSIQGEGLLCGMRSAFVRIAGCAMHCSWCDTAYAHDASSGTPHSVEALCDAVAALNSRYVVITGGEPMTCDALEPLCHVLKSHGCHITIETAGIRPIVDIACDLMSISPKLPSAQPAITADPAAITELMAAYNYQLKFVVAGSDDLAEIDAFLADLSTVEPERIWLMPQARSREAYRQCAASIAELAIARGWNFSPRLHLELWGNVRGK